jgi:hypothetical protein
MTWTFQNKSLSLIWDTIGYTWAQATMTWDSLELWTNPTKN